MLQVGPVGILPSVEWPKLSAIMTIMTGCLGQMGCVEVAEKESNAMSG
jgi:hypothetical protein